MRSRPTGRSSRSPPRSRSPDSEYATGGEFDSTAPEVTEWYDRTDEDGNPIDYDYERGVYLDADANPLPDEDEGADPGADDAADPGADDAEGDDSAESSLEEAPEDGDGPARRPGGGAGRS